MADNAATDKSCWFCGAPQGKPCAENCPDRPPAGPDRFSRRPPVKR